MKKLPVKKLDKILNEFGEDLMPISLGCVNLEPKLGLILLCMLVWLRFKKTYNSIPVEFEKYHNIKKKRIHTKKEKKYLLKNKGSFSERNIVEYIKGYSTFVVCFGYLLLRV